MNVTDLPELMRERSAQDPVPVLADGRMAAIGRKVTAARRRRAAGALAGLVLLVVAAAALPAVVGLRADHRPAPTASTMDRFPVYANGGQLVAHGSGAFGSGGISLTAPAGDLGLLVTSRCPDAPADLEIELQMVVNGIYHDLVCVRRLGRRVLAGVLPENARHARPSGHVRVHAAGDPADIWRQRADDRPYPDRTAGRHAVAVYRQLTFADYPLPPRPQTLRTLNFSPFGPDPIGMTSVRSDPNDPLTAKTLTLTLSEHCDIQIDCLNMAVIAQTPGEIDIRINGTLVTTARFWDYSGVEMMFIVVGTMQSLEPPYGDIHLTPGTTVTVTITPRYLTGAWEFAAALPQ